MSLRVLVVVVAILSTLAEAQISSISPWAMKGANLQGTGQSPFVGPQNNTQRFAVNIGSVTYSSPAIGHNGEVYVGLDSGTFLALNGSTGATIWSYNFGFGINTSPAVDAAGNIVMGSNGGIVVSLAPNGTVRWSRDCGGQISRGSPHITPDNTVYVAAGTRVWAFNNANGAIRFNYSASGTVFAPFASSLDGTVLYFGTSDSKMNALNLTSQTLRWSFSTLSQEVASGVAVGADGNIYFGCYDSRVYSLTPNGVARWNYPTGAVIYGAPAISSLDGTVYIGVQDGRLLALFPNNGTLRWSQPMTPNLFHQGPAIGIDNTVYYGTGVGGFFALNGATGVIRWSTTVSNSFYNTPAIAADGTLYVGNQNGLLYAFWGVGSNGNCTITAPPSLDLTRSSLVSTDSVTIAISATDSYSSVVLQFVNARNTSCQSNSGSNWWTVQSQGCNRFYSITQTLQNLLSQCGFAIDESVVDTTVYSAVITITTTRFVGNLRGVALNFTSVTVVEVDIAFTTTVVATTSTVSVFGSALTFAAMRNQTININSLPPTLTLQLFTSVQYPYQLASPILSTFAAFTSSIVPTTVQSGMPTAAACNASQIDSLVNGGSCTQSWTITITPSSGCPAQTTFNQSDWTVQYQIRCHNSFGGSCNLPSPSNASVLFSTASDNYCPRFITNTIDMSAQLQPFQNSIMTVPQNSFIFGTRSFFQATVTSPVQMSNVNIERVALTAGAASGVSTLYTKPFTTATSYFGTAGSFVSSFDASPTLMTVTDVNTGGPAFVMNASFSLVWNSAISSAVGDALVPTTVAVYLRVRFANVTQVGQPNEMVLKVNAKPLLNTKLLSTGATVSSVNVGVSAQQATTTVAPTASAAAPGVSTVAIVGLVVGAGFAVMVAVVGVWRIRRRSSKQQQHRKSSHLDLSTEIELSEQENSVATTEA